MRRISACVGWLIALFVGWRMPGLSWWALVPGALIVTAIAWRVSRCPHGGPLGLLPATTDLTGARLPARWRCDACGATWAARFDKEHTPVRRFLGYDESKAAHAARRAAELADGRRALAVRRAGFHVAGRATLRAAGPAGSRLDSPAVVSIRSGRRFGS